MPLSLTMAAYHRFHHYCRQFDRCEVSSLLVGYREGGDDVAVDVIHEKIIDADQFHVRIDANARLTKMAQFYVVGIIHTHPSDRSQGVPSNADKVSARAWGSLFTERYHRQLHFAIYAPVPQVLSVYNEYGQFVPWTLLE